MKNIPETVSLDQLLQTQRSKDSDLRPSVLVSFNDTFWLAALSAIAASLSCKQDGE